MTLLDTRELDDGTVLRTDVCILGAGAAGITMARRLAGTSLDVVVVESGGHQPDEPTQDLARGEVIGAPLLSFTTPMELHQVRLRYLGGTTNHWAGYCRPLEAIDFEVRPGLEVSGWPFGPDELAPWYDEATEVVALPSAEFATDHWVAQPGFTPPLLDTSSVTTSVFQIKFPYHLGPVHRRELEVAANVRVCLWGNATHIGMAPESELVEYVTVQTLHGRTVRVEAQVFVVALGGIENPRLLLASDDVRTAGIGNEFDLVGRYFTEHLQALGGVLYLHRSPEDLQLYNGIYHPPLRPDEQTVPDDRISIKGILTITREAMLERGLLGLEGQLLVADPNPRAPHYTDGLPVGPVADLARSQDNGIAGSYAFLQVLAEQELQADSRVTLGTATDALGMRQPQLDWRHSELDRRSIREGLRLIGRELGRLGLGRLQMAMGGVSTGELSADAGPLSLYAITPSSFDTEDFPLGVGFHHMCTTRMDTDPRRGVVDPDGKVHGTANLYIAGSSTFATGGVATPTFTIIALALRLADHLARITR